MTYDIDYLLPFSANLIFTITNLYGGLLKRFYVPQAYKKDFGELYPAQRAVSALYLTQIIELPYLLMIGRPEALFYVNGMSVLVFSSFMLIMVWEYFFLRQYSYKELFRWLAPAMVTIVLLTLPLLQVVPFSPAFERTMFAVVTFVFGGYTFCHFRFWQKLRRRIREMGEDEYSNENDFPLNFAIRIEWLPIAICLLMYLCFVMDQVWVKMGRDVLFTIVNIWFVMCTLNPHRTKNYPQARVLKKKEESQADKATPKYRLTSKQCNQMEEDLMKVLQDEKLYLNEHLTLHDLTRRMNTNRNYLSEVISRSHYRTFYQLVNTLRIDYACEMIRRDPEMKFEQVGFASGFTSGSLFSRVFKRIKGYLQESLLLQ